MAKNANRKMSEKEVANEKSERIMNGVAAWAGFYRENPHRFVKDYLNVNLKLFQKILLYAMMHNDFFSPKQKFALHPQQDHRQMKFC